MHLQDMGLITLRSCYQLRQEIMSWAESCTEAPDDTFIIFRKFLENYCVEMLGDQFDMSKWASLMQSEMCFLSQFFAFPPQFSEPSCRKKREIYEYRD